MPSIRRFEEMEAWRKARQLTRCIYAITKRRPFAADVELKRQIRRATISVMSNIAEGFERGSNREFAQFLSVAAGSAGEVRSQLYVALDEGYITASEFRDLATQTRDITKMVYGLINYLEGPDAQRRRHRAPNSGSSPVHRTANRKR